MPVITVSIVTVSVITASVITVSIVTASGVTAAHRSGAFEAIQYIVDAVKTDAPIWKKDHWSDGSESWVESK